MAKNTKQNPIEDEFYEALPAAAIPTAASRGLEKVASHWRDNLINGGKTAAVLAGAATQDLGIILRQTGRKAFGQTARRIYLALFLLGGAVGGTAAFTIASSTYAIYSGDLANPSVLLNKKNTGTTLLDRNGKVLYQVYGATTRNSIDFEQIPQPLIKATLAAEDPEYYNHPGVSFRGIVRAAFNNLTNGDAIEGGSTLTQQFVKTALLTPDRSYIRKAQEIALAVQIEQKYSKDEILEMYLNSVYYGQGSHGIGTAAQTYFHKDVKDLTIGEAAMLAGLPLGPSRFDPAIYPNTGLARRDYVLDRMRQLGYISEQEYAAAKAEPLTAHARQVKIEAPHFVFYTLNLLRQKYGDDMVERGGITVTTSLDMDKQKAAEDIVRRRIAGLAGHNASNAGLVSLDVASGEIIAMVGSADFNNEQFGKFNVVTSSQQPGSSFKPIVYLTAFKEGWTGGTKIEDKPIKEPNGDGTFYQPKNFDEKYRGSMTIRRALANSLNTPTVQAVKFAGVGDVIQTARDFGLGVGTDESRFGLSVGLGVIEVQPLEMAAAYAAIANGGLKVTPKAILKVANRNGKDITIKDIPAAQPRVIDPRLTYMMTSILSDNATRAESFGPNSPLKLSRPAAAKTGTTEKFRDDWTVGYTPDMATAVWVGNNDNSPLLNLTGIQGAAPIWHEYMEYAHQGLPVRGFTRPDGIQTAKVCLFDGGLANPWDKNVVEEVFLAGKLPTKQCGTPNPKPPEPPKEEKPAEQPNAQNQGKPEEKDKDPGQGGSPDGDEGSAPEPTPDSGSDSGSD